MRERTAGREGREGSAKDAKKTGLMLGAHHGQARGYVQSARRVAVSVDLEKFFDCVNHNILMGRLGRRGQPANVLLDEVDRELARLGACFVRHADDQQRLCPHSPGRRTG